MKECGRLIEPIAVYHFLILPRQQVWKAAMIILSLFELLKTEGNPNSCFHLQTYHTKFPQSDED